MTAPTPRQFEKMIEQTRKGMNRRLDELLEVYMGEHGAYETSHERVVRENAGKVMSGGASDPTAGIVGDPLDRERPGLQRAIRKQLEDVEGTLSAAENMINGITVKITKAMDRLDPREGFEALRYPISVSQAQLEESKQAQERRKTRGDEG